jgi:IclR family acetate operon transcriptional repressor
VHALVRGLDVLTTVIDSDEPISLATVAKRTGLNRATAYRMLTTLVEAGYLSFDPDEPVYSPGPLTLRYLRGSRLEGALRHRVLPLLNGLAEQSQETVSLMMATWPDLVCIAVVLSPHPVRRHRSVGDVSDMTNSGTGRAYLAYAPEGDIEALLALRPLRPFASGATYTRDMLVDRLADVRDSGYAMAVSETVEGMNGLVAPLFTQLNSRPVAVISVSGPDSRWSSDAMLSFAPVLLKGIADAGFGPTDPAPPTTGEGNS